MWNDAIDELAAAERRIGQRGTEPTIDQQISIAQVKALLSIGQELSAIRHNGVNPAFFEDE